MSTKPDKLPRWADISGDIVEPNSGKKDTGWVDDEEPANEFFNWLQYYNYLWAQYLNDGDLDGDITIDGNLEITGEFYHGDIEEDIPVTWVNGAVGDAAGTVSSGSSYYSSGSIAVTIPKRTGRRLKSVKVKCVDNGNNDITLTVYKQTLTSGGVPGTPSSLGTATTTGIENTNVNDLSVTGLTETFASNTKYSIQITAPHVNHDIHNISFIYDYPSP